MLIICDNCSRPISGTVKRVAGNFNLHPDCLAQLGRQGNHESTAVLRRSQEPSVSAFGDWKVTVAGVPREMK
jgi:hypothetical protein